MNKKGFTLIELLVVISIIGLLSSVVLVSLNSARAKARDAKRMSDLGEIQKALEFYFDSSNGTAYPLCAGNTVCSTTGYSGNLGVLDVVASGFLSSMPIDPKNVSGQYGYYYARGYKKTGAASFSFTNSATDYIMATRLESVAGIFSGWDNGNLNYLLGN